MPWTAFQLQSCGFGILLLMCLALPSWAAPKDGTGVANCTCYCKSRTADGVSVALPKTLKAPDGDITKCDFLAGIACRNTVPDDVSYGTLSLCKGVAQSPRPTRTPGKLPVHQLDQAE
jgi:hypothetical protein